jgi:hypothetical protein
MHDMDIMSKTSNNMLLDDITYPPTRIGAQFSNATVPESGHTAYVIMFRFGDGVYPARGDNPNRHSLGSCIIVPQ